MHIRTTFGALLACTCLVPVSAHAQSQFNGSWTVTRTVSQQCGPQGSVFTIRINNGSVSAPGGRGSVNAAGRIRFPGVANGFSGELHGSEGNGTFEGRCSGTFTARKN